MPTPETHWSPGEAAAPVKMQPPARPSCIRPGCGLPPLRSNSQRPDHSAMLDIKWIRDNPKALAEALVKRQWSSEEARKTVDDLIEGRGAARASRQAAGAPGAPQRRLQGDRQRHARRRYRASRRAEGRGRRDQGVSVGRRGRGAPARQGAGRRAGGDPQHPARRRAGGSRRARQCAEAQGRQDADAPELGRRSISRSAKSSA